MKATRITQISFVVSVVNLIRCQNGQWGVRLRHKRLWTCSQCVGDQFLSHLHARPSAKPWSWIWSYANSPSLPRRGEKGRATPAVLEGEDLVLSNTAFTLFSHQIKQVSDTCSVMPDSLQPHEARQAPLSMEFSRQEYWSGLPFPSPGNQARNQCK